MGWLHEFKEFAMKGNAVDLAVGLIIGAEFGKIVNSLVNDILMPPLGLMVGRADFKNFFWVLKPGEPAGPYVSLAEAHKAGAVTINFGLFITSVVSFVIIAFAVFLLVRTMNRLRKLGHLG